MITGEIQQTSSLAETFMSQGWQLMLDGFYQKALEDFELVKTFDSNFIPAYVWSARCYYFLDYDMLRVYE